MKKLLIDRFEGIYAVCEQEDKSMVNILKIKLPKEVKEGNCIIVSEDGSMKIDMEETKRSKDRITKLMDDLFE